MPVTPHIGLYWRLPTIFFKKQSVFAVHADKHDINMQQSYSVENSSFCLKYAVHFWFLIVWLYCVLSWKPVLQGASTYHFWLTQWYGILESIWNHSTLSAKDNMHRYGWPIGYDISCVGVLSLRNYNRRRVLLWGRLLVEKTLSDFWP